MQAIASNPYLLCGERYSWISATRTASPSITTWKGTVPSGWKRPCCAPYATTRATATPVCPGRSCWKQRRTSSTSPPKSLAAALDSCIQTGKLAVRMFDGTPYIYLPDLLAAEQDIADRLAMLTRRGKQTARNLDKNIQILELAQGFAYAPLQKEAIRKAMTENCLVLTGGPGTGKTTTVNASCSCSRTRPNG